MSKQSNTAIFILIATVVNIVIMFAIFILVFVVAGLLFDLNGNLGVIVLGLSFVISIGGSIFIYSKLVNWAVVKFDLEEKLVPIFSRRKGRKK
ncbi:MAG: leader peptide processing enzyme [Sphaerochaetaceae bacterium]|jgi:membrane protein YdbS with pleckstrin-like domain|nr:leader peptide processing enzyme [Sphaerochaetaceae bacterium]MDC7236337.1 leader peptide processing enzyme [Sphaerochaetaceae bacterium]MDC7249313.1 leader peptide processing enzyme [Sphaerochaetaceae bacterium]